MPTAKPLDLIPFHCPQHGRVLDASPHSLVECHCGADATPEGVSPLEHRRRWHDRKRQERSRSKRDNARP